MQWAEVKVYRIRCRTEPGRAGVPQVYPVAAAIASPMPTAARDESQTEPLLTIEELAAVVGDTPGELIDGSFVPMRPTGWPHAFTEAHVTAKLQQYLDANLVLDLVADLC